jgi:hypothetical protein
MDNPNKVQSNVTGTEIFGGMYTLKLQVCSELKVLYHND